MSSSSILSLIYRVAGPWGAGKGANLTAADFDNNQWAIQQAVEELSDNPSLPRNIQNVVVNGNKFSFQMDDGVTVFGPFTLPVASFAFRGAWAPATAYLANDVFLAESSMWFVNRDFTSEDTFNPSYGEGVGGAAPYAVLMIPYGAPAESGASSDAGGTSDIRISAFVAGKPGAGLTSGDTVWGVVADVAMTAPANLDSAKAVLDVAPTALYILQVAKNGSVVGQVQWEVGETVGSFGTSGADVVLSQGDRFQILAPSSADATAAGLYLVVPFIITPELDSSSGGGGGAG